MCNMDPKRDQLSKGKNKHGKGQIGDLKPTTIFKD